jgi:two-component system cell cycle response regulator
MSADWKTRVTNVKATPTTGGEACMVRIYPPGTDMGRKFELPEDVSVGRDASNAIVIDKDSVSRRHCQIVSRGGKKIIIDLDSTNGTYVNDEAVKEAELRNGDLVKVGDTIFKFLYGGNVESSYHEEIYRMTIIDGLTEAYNKRYLLEHLEREMARCKRYGRGLAVLMIDIDRFKSINDTHGHLTGDHVLRELGVLVRKRIRREELFARYGGEEFSVVIPEAMKDTAMQAAESLRRLVAEHHFEFEGDRIPVTISIGVGMLDDDINDPLNMLRVADENLYKAKRTGRNKVVGD